MEFLFLDWGEDFDGFLLRLEYKLSEEINVIYAYLLIVHREACYR